MLICRSCEGSENVVWFCKTCPGPLCIECQICHGDMAFATRHRIVPYLTDGEDILACEKHNDGVRNTYCKDCDVFCCDMCVEDDHPAHTVYLGVDDHRPDSIQIVNTQTVQYSQTQGNAVENRTQDFLKDTNADANKSNFQYDTPCILGLFSCVFCNVFMGLAALYASKMVSTRVSQK